MTQTIKVSVPSVLPGEISVAGHTVAEVLGNLCHEHPTLKEKLFAHDKLVPTAIVFVNQQRNFDMDKQLANGDKVVVIFAIAGGEDSGKRNSHAMYLRQVSLPHFGMEGQEKLRNRSVLVIGAGGLGTPASLYLAAAGVGTLGLVDGDTVDITNLSRQVLFTPDDIGRSKVDVIGEELVRRNDQLHVFKYSVNLDETNVDELIQDYDVIVNGSDNFKTRYILNEACVRHQKPWVDSSVLQYTGQIVTFRPGKGCYSCLYPGLQDAETNCSTMGILGPLCGVFGSFLAVQAVKLLSDLSFPDENFVYYYDAFHEVFERFQWSKREECSCCNRLSIQEKDVSKNATPHADSSRSISSQEFFHRLSQKQFLILDLGVGLGLSELAGNPVISTTVEDLFERFHDFQFDAHKEIVAVCPLGQKSLIAADFLSANGYKGYSLVNGAAGLIPTSVG